MNKLSAAPTPSPSTAQADACASDYFVSVQLSDANWNR